MLKKILSSKPEHVCGINMTLAEIKKKALFTHQFVIEEKYVFGIVFGYCMVCYKGNILKYYFLVSHYENNLLKSS